MGPRSRCWLAAMASGGRHPAIVPRKSPQVRISHGALGVEDALGYRGRVLAALLPGRPQRDVPSECCTPLTLASTGPHRARAATRHPRPHHARKNRYSPPTPAPATGETLIYKLQIMSPTIHPNVSLTSH